MSARSFSEGIWGGIAAAYGRVVDEWLPQSGESADDRPCMELYRRVQADTLPEDLVTDLCVPLSDGRPADAGQRAR